MRDARTEEERRRRAQWDRDTYGPAAQQPLPDNVDRLFESAWVALERERVDAVGKLPAARKKADAADDKLEAARREARKAGDVVTSITDKLRRLTEQQKGMACS